MPSTRRKNIPTRPAQPTASPKLELVRLSRVTVAQKRIAAGYYDRDEVRDRLAKAVLEVITQD